MHSEYYDIQIIGIVRRKGGHMAELAKYERKAELLKTLGHPVRLCIVNGLMDQASMPVFILMLLSSRVKHAFHCPVQPTAQITPLS